MTIRKVAGSGLVNTGRWLGKNKIGSLIISDIKQGARRFLKDASVTDVLGVKTVTLTVQDEYIAAAWNDGAVIMVDGVGFGGGLGTGDGQANAAYAMNRQYVVQGRNGNVYTCIQSGNAADIITSVVTMTIASPCVVTWNAHGLISGCIIRLTNSGGNLPTGVTVNDPYWITYISANTFNLSDSYANYLTGTFVVTGGAQTGVHTGTSHEVLPAMTNTVDVACYLPEQACPKAYGAIASDWDNPTGSGVWGPAPGNSYPINIIAGSVIGNEPAPPTPFVPDIGNRLEVGELVIESDRFRITEVIQYDVDDARYFSLGKVVDEVGGRSGLSGTYAYTTPFVQPGSTFAFFQNSASPSTIEAHRIMRGVYSRTGLTAATVDTLDTTANIIESLASAGFVIHTWTVFNQSAYPLTILPADGDTNTTFFGNFIIPGNTSVSYEFFLSGPDTIQINQRRREAEHTYLPPAPKRKTNSSATAAVLTSIEDPCVVTWTAHGLVTGDVVRFTTTGGLPAGITASTNYWITVTNANQFKLSATGVALRAGTYVATSGVESGIHTGTVANWSAHRPWSAGSTSAPG